MSKSTYPNFIKKVKCNVATKNYDVAEFLDANRKPNDSHIKKIADSMCEMGWMGNVFILKTSANKKKNQLIIIDGQHRLLAAKRLGIKFSYDQYELVDDTFANVCKVMALLNNTSKQWSTKNYLKTYSANDVREYKKFDELLETTGLTITDLEKIYLGSSGAKEHRDYKNGVMKFYNEKQSDAVLQDVLRVLPHIPKKAFTRRALYKVMDLVCAKKKAKFIDKIIATSINLKENYSGFSENENEFCAHLMKIYKAL